MPSLTVVRHRLVRSGGHVTRIVKQAPAQVRHKGRFAALQSRYVSLLMPIGAAAFDVALPAIPWSGDAGRGAHILDGRFEFDRTTVEFDDAFWARLDQMNPRWLSRFYDFRWLHDVAACGQDAEAAGRVRTVIEEWWQDHDLSPVSRHPDIVGERLAQWLQHQPFILQEASGGFRKRWMRELYASLLLLERVRRRKQERTGLPVLKGIIFAALTMPKSGFLLEAALESLYQAMRTRFFPDGGHFSRSPESHLRELKSLLEIVAALRHHEMVLDEAEYTLLQKMMDVMVTLVHPDNNLALFNDSTEQPIAEAVRLWRSWNRESPKPQRYLPYMQFARLPVGKSTLLMDAGAPNPVLSSTFYGAMGLEFSHEEERIFVNCGGYRGDKPEWHKVCRVTAAHSTLSLDDANSWQPPNEAKYTLVIQPEVSCQIEEEPDKLSVDAAYNGYVSYAGLLHYRRLTLSQAGDKLEGVDMLMPHKSLVSRDTHRVQIRFHLHPSVTITRISRGAIELQTKRGQRWRFITPKDYAAGAEDSVYLGRNGSPRKTMQLSIEGMITSKQDLRVHWELIKIG